MSPSFCAWPGWRHTSRWRTPAAGRPSAQTCPARPRPCRGSARTCRCHPQGFETATVAPSPARLVRCCAPSSIGLATAVRVECHAQGFETATAAPSSTRSCAAPRHIAWLWRWRCALCVTRRASRQQPGRRAQRSSCAAPPNMRATAVRVAARRWPRPDAVGPTSRTTAAAQHPRRKMRWPSGEGRSADCGTAAGGHRVAAVRNAGLRQGGRVATGAAAAVVRRTAALGAAAVPRHNADGDANNHELAARRWRCSWAPRCGWSDFADNGRGSTPAAPGRVAEAAACNFAAPLCARRFSARRAAARSDA